MPAGHHKMIEHAHVYQRQRLFQRLGKCVVGRAGFGRAGGMVVRHRLVLGC